jgi:phosphoglycerol transferase MdoB-like AlkP superfamily enzyme
MRIPNAVHTIHSSLCGIMKFIEHIIKNFIEKNNKMNKELKITVLTIIRIYVLSLSTFLIFRLLLFISEMYRLNFSQEVLKNTLYAFIVGLRFDIVVTGYIIFFPALIMMILSIINKKINLFLNGIFYFLLVLFSISFIINAADMPYFNQFFKRFDIGAFEWMDSPLFVVKMIIEEPRYVLIFIPLILLILVFYKFLKQIFLIYKTTEYPSSNKRIVLKTAISLFVLSLIFIGIRGRLQKKSPIRIGTAYFCNDPLLNQLGLNPVFTLFRSYLDSKDIKNKPINLIDNQIAINNVKKYLGIKESLNALPIARKIVPDIISNNNPNVVIIIMESMSAAKMQRFGNNNNLTPFLDSLTYQSYFFKNVYTAGEHTFNGIFSTLFSFPALYRQHTMKHIRRYSSMSYVLKQLGYSTTFFITHDGQFDNVEGFLHANDFDNVITQSDYPIKEVKTTLGVPDDFMFRFSIPKINNLSKTGKPFFVAFMTASDHGPYYIPDYFHPHNNKIKKQIVEYADWSLNKFITLASKTDWFDKTIFIFVADHGAPINVRYQISLNYHHTPLIFYAPNILEPKEFDCIGGQIDIFPTLMGILKQPYINNTFGVDLINEKRPYIIINGDDKIADLDNEFLFILNNKEKELYKYKNLDTTNYINKFPEKAKEMEIYLRSNLQTYQSMLLNEESLYIK